MNTVKRKMIVRGFSLLIPLFCWQAVRMVRVFALLSAIFFNMKALIGLHKIVGLDWWCGVGGAALFFGRCKSFV